MRTQNSLELSTILEDYEEGYKNMHYYAEGSFSPGLWAVYDNLRPVSRMREIDDADFVTPITMWLDVKTAACDRRQTYPPLLDYFIL